MGKTCYGYAILAAIVVGLGLTPRAKGDTILATFTGSSGSLAARAKFSTNGTDLFLTLTNSASTASGSPAATLNAIFLQGNLSTFSPASAALTPGSVAYDVDHSGKWEAFNWGSNTVGDVGGEWATKKNISAYGQSWDYGISSTGLNIFGPSDLIGGANLAGPVSPDGNEFGLVSSSTAVIGQTAPSDLTGHNNNPVVATSVTFDLGIGTTLGSVTGVLFQYGTSIGEPTVVKTTPDVPTIIAPLPQAAWMGLVLVSGICAVRKLPLRDIAR